MDYYSLRTKGNVKKVDIEAELEVGKYRYRIKNEAADEDFSEWYYFEVYDETKQSGSSLVFDVYAGYILPYILFDDIIPDFLDERFFFLSATAGIDVMPFATKAGSFGLALKGFYSRIQKDFSSCSISGNLVSAYLDLVYQKKLSRIFMLDVHAGAGGLYFLDFEASYESSSSKSLNSINLSLDAGLDLYLFFTTNVFARIGSDFTYSIMPDMQLGQLIPEFSIGFRL